MPLDIIFSLAACTDLITINDLKFYVSNLPAGGGMPAVSITVKDPLKGPVDSLMPIYLRRVDRLDDLNYVRKELIARVDVLCDSIQKKMEADIGERKSGAGSP